MNDHTDRSDWAAGPPANAPSHTPTHVPPLPPRYERPAPSAGAETPRSAPAPVPPQPAAHVHQTHPFNPAAVPAGSYPPPSGTGEKKQAGTVKVAMASFVAAVVGAAAALGGAWGLGAFDGTTKIEQGANGTTVVREQATPATGGGRGVDVVKVADTARPAIVNIKVSTARGQGSGSGVIFRSDGMIMTNNHVVDTAKTVKVEMTDGHTLDGQVLGTDPETDIAVVKVDGTDFPTAPLGTATNLRIGQPTVAIGNPLGLAGGPSVSEGIVSALGREVNTDGNTLFDMIQTDAAISPGSSGGALLDGNGSVIGITTAIAVSDAGAEGIGFATPIDVARKVAEDISTSGKSQHSFLGIRGVDTADQGGATVVDVTPDSPAQKAGLRKDDTITAVNGEKVTSMAGLKVKLRTFSPGDEVTLTVDGKDVKVTLGAS